MQSILSINIYNRLISFLYVVFFLSIFCSFRGITSIAIGLIFIIGMMASKKATGRFFSNILLTPFIIGCLLIFILNVISLFYTNNFKEGLNHVSLTSALVIVPLALSLSMYTFNKTHHTWLMKYFTILLVITSLYCLIISISKILAGESLTVLFYHSLVKPLDQHAIHYSFYVFFDLLFLIEYSGKVPVFNNSLRYAIIIFLSIFLFLLSSKLVLGFYLLYLIYKYIRNIRKTKASGKYLITIPFVIILGILAITSKNPIGARFREISGSNLKILNQSKYAQGDYFDGLQFRLLQWRFTYEIMKHSHKWVTGLTPGDAQTHINNKYIEYDLYTGKPGTDDHGFLGYNTHNQFLQSFLETGLLGLTVFIFLCCTLIQLMYRMKSVEFTFLIMTILAFCFTDTPLGTQYGLIIFLFLPLFAQFGWKAYPIADRKKH